MNGRNVIVTLLIIASFAIGVLYTRVQTLEKQAKESTGLIVTAFKGLKTTEINEFRQKLRALKGE